jgi:isopentenyldiphosphate isomerase
VAEYFDLCDDRGRALGIVKERSLVHRDGDWHRVFHCWLVHPRGPSLLLQLRAPTKETSPGLWDVSVGGHYSAGEGIEGGLREIQEELGLSVGLGDLTQVGWQRWEDFFSSNGLIEREVADIFFLLRPVRMADLKPLAEEISAVAYVPTHALRRLAEGHLGQITVPARRPDGHDPFDATITLDSLVPRNGERGYYRKAARFAEAFARGEARVHRRRWW